MMKKLIPVLLAAGTLASIPAQSEAGYFEDRFNDIVDIFRVRGGAPSDGRAIGLKARATALAQVGYVKFDGIYAGLDRRALGLVREERREFGASLFYFSYNEMNPVNGNLYLTELDDPWNLAEDRRIVRNLPHWDDGRERPLSLGVEIANPLFGLDLGMYPEELADAVLGIVTIDIFNDDRSGGFELPFLEASGPPVPDPMAPFADRQAKNDAQMLRWAEEELERLGQLEEPAPGTVEAMNEALIDAENAPAMPPSVQEAAEEVLEDASEGEITPMEADEVIDELEAEFEEPEMQEPEMMEAEEQDTDDQQDADDRRVQR